MSDRSTSRMGLAAAAGGVLVLVIGGVVTALTENVVNNYFFVTSEQAESLAPHELNRLWIKEGLERVRSDSDADILAIYGYPPDLKTRARLMVVQRPGLDVTWKIGEWTPTNVAGRKEMVENHQRRKCESVFLHSLPKQSEFRETFIRRNLDSAISYPISDRGDLVGYISWQTLRPTADRIGRPQGDWHASVCFKLEKIAPFFGSSLRQYVTNELSLSEGG